MTCRRPRAPAVVAVLTCLASAACGREEPAATASAQLVTGPSTVSSGIAAAHLSAGTHGAGVIAFPPRNEPFAFRDELERKYRDGLRRSPSSTYVDLEGDIVWTQEYLRYRVNRCDHAAAAQKVLDQIDGKGIAPTCVDALTGFWDGTSSYFNAPFTMDIRLVGSSITGRYVDRHDIGYIGGTYGGGGKVLILVNFGDTGIAFDGEFDGPERIRGMIRGGVIGGTYPFVMTRRP
jgi:hypothetical protein